MVSAAKWCELGARDVCYCGTSAYSTDSPAPVSPEHSVRSVMHHESQSHDLQLSKVSIDQGDLKFGCSAPRFVKRHGFALFLVFKIIVLPREAVC